MVEKDDLQIITLEEYILTPGEDAKRPPRGISNADNITVFLADLVHNKLDRYKGTYVAYNEGNLIGQSEEAKKLWQKASTYYKTSNLSVFLVPSDGLLTAGEVAKTTYDNIWDFVDRALRSFPKD